MYTITVGAASTPTRKTLFVDVYRADAEVRPSCYG